MVASDITFRTTRHVSDTETQLYWKDSHIQARRFFLVRAYPFSVCFTELAVLRWYASRLSTTASNKFWYIARRGGGWNLPPFPAIVWKSTAPSPWICHVLNCEISVQKCLRLSRSNAGILYVARGCCWTFSSVSFSDDFYFPSWTAIKRIWCKACFIYVLEYILISNF